MKLPFMLLSALRPLLGPDHPELLEAMRAAADDVAHRRSAPYELRARLARLVSARAPGDRGKVLFAETGDVARDSAARAAMALTGRDRVLRWNGSVDDFMRKLDAVGPSHIAGVIADTALVNSELLAGPADYAEIRRLATEHGMLYIADEVAGGFARTGRWFATEAFDVVPDLTVFGSDLDSGLVGIGGVVFAADLAKRLSTEYFCGVLTDCLHPLAAAASIASVVVIEREQLLRRTAELGERIIRAQTADWLARHRSLRAVVGSGLRWRLELATDDERVIAAFTREARRAGVWPVFLPTAEPDATRITTPSAGPRARRGPAIVDVPRLRGASVEFAPSLTVSEDILSRGVAVIDEALTAADRHIGRLSIVQAA
jgi:taurine--2-oxoglutarate transaminase